MPKGSNVFDAGAVEIAIDYRAQMADQGLAVQVYGQVDGQDTELLRFDCFDQAPHYHYAPGSSRNVRLFMDKTTVGNPFGWTLDNLRKNLPAMVKRAGFDNLATEVETQPVSEATLAAVEAKGRELARTNRRTVTHRFERMLDGDVYQIGNVKIGLEYRILANDEGMAIHVLSDVAGQEIELLAFDCFEKGPHYHYGPRNQDVRLYWDTTTSGETLRWTLDQFKAGNLGKMIGRAGYPTIATDLDENLLQAMLPTIEKRAFDLVAENKAAQAVPSDQRKTKAQLIQELEALRSHIAAL